MADAHCSVCGQGLANASPEGGPYTCWLCHPLNETLREEKRQRIASQRKKTEAETRKLDKRRQSEAGEGFRQKG